MSSANTEARLEELYEKLAELDSDKWILPVNKRDMVAQYRADSVGREFMFKGWNHALNRQQIVYQYKDLDFWGGLYLLFVEIGATIGGIDTSIAGFFKMLQYKGSFSDIWTAEMLAELEQGLASWVLSRQFDTAAEPEIDTEPETPEPDGVDTASSDTAQTGVTKDDAASAVVKPATKPKSKSGSKSGPKELRQTKPRVHTGPVREVKDTPLSTNMGMAGTPVRPGDLDFRMARGMADVEAEFFSKQLGANAGHVKAQVSGVHTYLAEKALNLIERGFTERGIEHQTLGRGSAVSAALIAVLGFDELGFIELSPAMQLAVDILREQRGISRESHMADIAENTDRVARILADNMTAIARLLTLSETNARLSSLQLAERVGVSSIPVSNDPEVIDVFDTGAQEVMEQAITRVEQKRDFEQIKAQRSTNFYGKN